MGKCLQTIQKFTFWGVPEQHKLLVKDMELCILDFANLVDLVVKCSY